MNFNLFIARKLFREHGDVKKVSRPAILIATSGVAVGLAVMIISVCVVLGFKQESVESCRIRFSYTDSKLCVGHDKFPAAYCGAPCFDEGGRGRGRGGACAAFLQ